MTRSRAGGAGAGPVGDRDAAGAGERRSVILCDERGAALGVANVLDAHRGAGRLHRAFSAFVFRARGDEVLLQQRSRHKRLFPLRWANACCSHPAAVAEPLVAAAERRLREELGVSLALREAGAFVYRASDLAAGMSEYEYDTVLVGLADAAVVLDPDPREVAACRWMPVRELERDVRERSEWYAPWLQPALAVALTGLGGR